MRNLTSSHLPDMTTDWRQSNIAFGLLLCSLWCAILAALCNLAFLALDRKRRRRRTPVELVGIDEVCPRICVSQLEMGEREDTCCICLERFAGRNRAQASKPTLRRLCCE